MKDTILEIFEKMKEFSIGELYDNGYVCSPQNFIRDRKLGFLGVVLFLLNLPKRKLGLELNDYQDNSGLETFSVSAFSQARYKIKHKYFIDLNKYLIKNIYEDLSKELKTWRGHRLISWDGTTQSVLFDAACEAEFGGSKNQHGIKPLARAVHCYDVLNTFLLDSKLFSYNIGEQTIVKELITNHEKNDIAIYDRNFGSYELMYLHDNQELKYIIRAELTFNKQVIAFEKSKKRSQIVQMPITKIALEKLTAAGYKVSQSDMIRVRLIKVTLITGVTEILMTNLLEAKKYPKHIFGELYKLRWNDETGYDVLKNKLQIEIFSGHKVEAIYQDFYATMIAYNINILLTIPTIESAKEVSIERKYEYKINRNFSIGIIKKYFVAFIYDKNPKIILDKIIKLCLTELIPIIPDRNEKRNFKTHKIFGKYYTSKNYRRAV